MLSFTCRNLIPASLVLVLSFVASQLTPGTDAPRSVASVPSDGTWSLAPPPEWRDGESLIYDSLRHRMILFGGNLLGDVWALSLDGSPRWTHIVTRGIPPGVRSRHSAVYDAAADRMIVYGGNDNTSNGPVGSVWALSFSGAPTWSPITTSGEAPAARKNHCAVYDPGSQRMLVVGGSGADPVDDFADVWALSLGATPEWTEIGTAGFGPTGATVGCLLDSARNRLVAIPSRSQESFVIYELALDGSPTWSQMITQGTAPEPRLDYSLTYDPIGERAIVFGGGGAAFYNDAWQLKFSAGNEWQQLFPSGLMPPGQSGPHAIFDLQGARMVIFGGTPECCGINNAVWALSLGGSPAWAELMPNDTPPDGRIWETTVYDQKRNRALVFGGFTGSSSCCNDTWSFSVGTTRAWDELKPPLPLPGKRVEHSAIYDPVRDRMIIFGGMSLSNLNDLWALSLSEAPTWIQLAAQGGPMAARWGHTAIYDPVRDRMIVFGGLNASKLRADNEVWSLTLSGTPTWTRITPQGPQPFPRVYHTAIYDPVGDRMVVFGGEYGPQLNDVWGLSLGGTSSWTDLSPAPGTPAPASRKYHSAVYEPNGGRMIIFGGLGNNAQFDDTWAFSLGPGGAWTRLALNGLPPGPAWGHAAVYDPTGHQMWVFLKSPFGSLLTWQLSLQDMGMPPDCSQATALPAEIWPPEHTLLPVTISGVTDPDGDPVTIRVTGVTQDEPLDEQGDGSACPDALIVDDTAKVRAERSATGNGRIYTIAFTASDPVGASCRGSVVVCVPHDQGKEAQTFGSNPAARRRPASPVDGGTCVDDGQRFNSIGPCVLNKELVRPESGTKGRRFPAPSTASQAPPHRIR